MKLSSRAYLGVLLALMLAFTGQSMAVARGMPGAAGEITLCTGTGPTMLRVDDNGDPVGPPHICPDFAASLFAFAPAAPFEAVRPSAHIETLRPPERIDAVSRKAPRATARDPPAAA